MPRVPRRPVFASPGPAPGRVQAGAGGVLTGLVGVAGCSKGRRGRNTRQGARYEQRQTRQVSIALSWHCFLQKPAPRRRRGSNASADTGVAGGGCRPIPGHFVQRTNPRTLKAILEHPLPIPDADVVQHGIALAADRPGWPWCIVTQYGEPLDVEPPTRGVTARFSS